MVQSVNNKLMGQWPHYTLMALWSLMMDAEMRWWKSQCCSTSTNYRERRGAASPSVLGSGRSTCPLSSPVVQPERRLISALLQNTGPELCHHRTVFCDWLHSCVVVRARCNPSERLRSGLFSEVTCVQIIHPVYAAEHLLKTSLPFPRQAKWTNSRQSWSQRVKMFFFQMAPEVLTPQSTATVRQPMQWANIVSPPPPPPPPPEGQQP